MEMTSARYNEITEKMERCVTEYEKMNFGSNKQTLFLANGDVLNIRVLKNNIPHLLGVNLDYLTQSNLFKSGTDAYTKLKYFLENLYRFSRLVIDQKKLDYDLMFSDYVDNKLESFINNIKIRTDDMQFVVKYDSEKTYGLEPIADICDYYIIRKINDVYYVLGVIKNEKNNIYNPVTSKMYKDEKEFNNFIERISKKQEITYPTTLKIENIDACYENSFTLRKEGRIANLQRVINVANQYDATASVAKDYCYSLNLLNDSKTISYKVLSVLKTLSDNIKNGVITDVDNINDLMEEMDIPDELLGLINVCNDNICNSFETENTSYTQLHDERNTLKQELKSLREELTASNHEVERLTKENEELIEQNDNYSMQMDIIEEAYQKIKDIKK